MYMENIISQIPSIIPKNSPHPPIYQLFPKDHYRDAENHLTKIKLQNLDIFSRTIEDPIVLDFGQNVSKSIPFKLLQFFKTSQTIPVNLVLSVLIYWLFY